MHKPSQTHPHPHEFTHTFTHLRVIKLHQVDRGSTHWYSQCGRLHKCFVSCCVAISVIARRCIGDERLCEVSDESVRVCVRERERERESEFVCECVTRFVNVIRVQIVHRKVVTLILTWHQTTTTILLCECVRRIVQFHCRLRFIALSL